MILHLAHIFLTDALTFMIRPLLVPIHDPTTRQIVGRQFHGNAISVYFQDPEGNGIEIFCDTPWHVPQPQVRPWDPSKSDEEVLASVEADFRDAPGFMPMEHYRAERAKAFGEG